MKYFKPTLLIPCCILFSSCETTEVGAPKVASETTEVRIPDIEYETTSYKGEEITIPTDVKYFEISREVFDQAEEKLRDLLINKKNLGEKFGWGNDYIDKLLIGGFVRGRISASLKDKYELDFRNFRSEIAFCLLPPHPHYRWWIAEKKETIEFFEYFKEVYNFTDECTIRKPRTDELAIIWRLIGWDITEPMFVVEEKDVRLVIDFDSEFKNIEWMEDISNVRFLISVNEKLVEVKPAIIGDPKNGVIHYMGSDGETFYVIE